MIFSFSSMHVVDGELNETNEHPSHTDWTWTCFVLCYAKLSKVAELWDIGCAPSYLPLRVQHSLKRQNNTATGKLAKNKEQERRNEVIRSEVWWTPVATVNVLFRFGCKSRKAKASQLPGTTVICGSDFRKGFVRVNEIDWLSVMFCKRF